MHASALPVGMFVYHVSNWYPMKMKTGVTASFEPPCGSWDLKPGPLEEQKILLPLTQIFSPED